MRLINYAFNGDFIRNFAYFNRSRRFRLCGDKFTARHARYKGNDGADSRRFGFIAGDSGLAGKSKENLRKHLMHGAVLVGLLGFLATVSSLLKLPALFNGTAERPLAVVSQFLTAIICLVFVILCVKSFIDARRSGAV